MDYIFTQYFDNEILKPENDEVFIDGGRYDLQSSIDFIYWYIMGSYKIIAFEPDENNYQLCLKRLPNETLLSKDEFTIYKLGLWDTTTTLRFNSATGMDSRVSDKGNKTINTTTIDEIMNGGKVTFIKLDLEGSEINALKGARKTICKYKPKLAISLYHKPQDILEIPLYILSLVPSYTLYIRNYTTNSQEVVLYCVHEH
jgi:FkbM family methyltransferase